jgi:hypothetical protein
MITAKLTRQDFNKEYHFQNTAKDKERCCRNCADFRRHPSAVSFCHFLFYELENQSEARVWGKSGCDRFSIPAAEEEQ